MRSSIIVALSLGFASTSAALPPGETRFQDGANHRVGDAGFAARFGRAPGPADGEAARMRAHLEHVRALLAAAPATRQDLAARRIQLLGYLGDYIAKGVTPVNTRMPWRTPVFIDDFENVCAVGYLIERSAGRALAERIAALHRFDYLEDIAATMPEVAAWIAGSGFTVDELASIQPGYEAPMAEQWSRWDLGGKVRPADGSYANELEYSGIKTRGTFKAGQMEGSWIRADRQGRVLGTGELRAGSGTWRSSYPNGKRLAEGPYVASDPHGAWIFYHESGNVAAEGRYERGVRHGAWRFYYDTKARTVIAAGAFKRGSVDGVWEHFDQAGARVAVSREATPAQWGQMTEGGHLLEVAPYASGVRHVMHRGSIAADDWRLDLYSLGDERIYVQEVMGDMGDRTYDAAGALLTKGKRGWLAADCGWSAKRKAIAKAGDITSLHGLLYKDGRQAQPVCGKPVAVAAERGARIDRALAAAVAVRAPSPAFVKDQVARAWHWSSLENGEPGAPEEDEVPAVKDAKDLAREADLTKTIAASMGWFAEFPHVDGRFIQVSYTLAGSTPGLRESEFAEPSGDDE